MSGSSEEGTRTSLRRVEQSPKLIGGGVFVYNNTELILKWRIYAS